MRREQAFRVLEPKCETIRSYNFPVYNWGLSGSAVYIKQQDPPDKWVLVKPGLTGHADSVSFRLCSDSRFYLRHSGYVAWAHSVNGANTLYLKDATYTVRKNKWFPGYDAYESVNFPGYFLRHQNYRVKISPYDGSNLFKMDASFKSQVQL